VDIFISYRRADSGYIVDQLYEKIIRKIGKNRVFIDRETIPKGSDFDQFLRKSVMDAKVVVIVIGVRWCNELNDRIVASERTNTQDFVRLEISLALSLSKPIIPVLVEGAEMPQETSLPEDLKSMAFINAMTLRRQPDFDQDFFLLLKEIQHRVGSKIKKPKESLTFGDLGI